MREGKALQGREFRARRLDRDPAFVLALAARSIRLSASPPAWMTPNAINPCFFTAPIKVASQSAVQSLKGLFSKKVQTSPGQDNQQIVTTLRGVQGAASPYETSHLEAFLKAQPQSRWGPATRNELARRQFQIRIQRRIRHVEIRLALQMFRLSSPRKRDIAARQ